MALPQPSGFDAFEDRSALRAALPYLLIAALLLAAAWYLITQFRWIGGVPVKADDTSMPIVALPPTPPPPPPPPPPEEKPPEPTEQPQPSPAEAQPSKAPEPAAAAPVRMDAAAEPGTSGVPAGPNSGPGAPGSPGTCLAPPCATSGNGGGMSLLAYSNYLTQSLQERVRRDERLSRLIFSSDLAVTVTPDGRVAGVRILGRNGGGDQAAKRLTELLEQVRGLTPPPAAMRFPQKITVQGRRPF